MHYPLFARVGAAAWGAYHAAHNARITMLVGPWMLGELCCAGALLLVAPPERRLWAVAAAVGVGVAWASTALLSVPLHGRLAGGLDLDQVDALVATNWVRTLAWTARGLLLGAWLWRELERGSGLELVE